MGQTPLVTVLVTTYNQEKYIANALDSVLAQRTDFPFEIYVSEDCGSDGTRAILEGYAARYPEQIRLRLRSRNVGISRNWYEGLHKLQKQVDFLRAHPQYAAVSHTLLLTDDAGSTYGTLPADPRILGKNASLPLFLRGVTYSCTACLAKNIFRTPDPKREAYVTANRSIADFALCMLYLDAGPVFVLPQAMAAYRVAGSDPSHQNYNGRQSGAQKYADFLDTVLASRAYWAGKYHFGRCLLAGSFYPFIDRVKYGGLGPFLHQMRRLPLGVKLAFPFYFAGRCLGLVWNRGAKHG